MTDHRALAAGLVTLTMLLAGCTATQDGPPSAGTTSLQLVDVPRSASTGDAFTVTYRLSGTTEGVTHTDVHFGDVMPDQGVTSRTAAGTPVGSGRYEATVVPEAAGTLFVRAHVVANGRDLWSDEATVDVRGGVVPPGPGPGDGGEEVGFQSVSLPDSIEAGVPFTLRYRLTGEGTSDHVGAHFSPNASAGLPVGFAPTSWPGQRASAHLGTSTPVTLPLDVAVQVTVPWPGTWHLRPHALVAGTNHWGDEVTLDVQPPEVPNIVLLEAPTRVVAGDVANLTFALNAQPGRSSHVGAHYSQTSGGDLGRDDGPDAWPGQRAAAHQGLDEPVDIPARFTIPLQFPLPGTWHYRGHAFVGADSVWSREVAVEVVAPPEPRVVVLSAPASTEVQPAVVGGRADPFEVEWTVLTPTVSNTTHTHIHHGPLRVEEPAHGRVNDYPHATAEQAGETPGIFRATVQPESAPSQGTYRFRAVAVVPGPDGQPMEVWSREWSVRLEPA